MIEVTVACPLCGTRFDPNQAEACSGCPLGSGCYLTCCPRCHYSWVEPDRTAASRWISRVLDTKSPKTAPDG